MWSSTSWHRKEKWWITPSRNISNSPVCIQAMPHWCSRHPAVVQSGIFPYYSLHFPQALGSAHSRKRLQKYLHSHYFNCAVFYLCPRYFSPSGYFLFYFLYQLPSDSEMLSSRLSSFLVITLEITIQRLIRKIALSELSLNNKHACYLLIVVTSPKKFSKLCSFMQA